MPPACTIHNIDYGNHQETVASTCESVKRFSSLPVISHKLLGFSSLLNVSAVRPQRTVSKAARCVAALVHPSGGDDSVRLVAVTRPARPGDLLERSPCDTDRSCGVVRWDPDRMSTPGARHAFGTVNRIPNGHILPRHRELQPNIDHRTAPSDRFPCPREALLMFCYDFQ